MRENNIFNIKSNYSFLNVLSRWILEKYSDPTKLANVTIFLPTKRSCREIKKILLRESKQKALILPKIMALGDLDYEELELTNESLPSPNFLKYDLLLIKEIKDWNNKTGLFGKNISLDQIAAIAAKLKKFLDEIERHQIDLSSAREIDDAEFSEHKQKILNFLKYFGSIWQSDLDQKNIISSSKYYNQTIKYISKNFQNLNLSKNPIIIAGSTGSIKATSELIKTIIQDPKNSLILFGLDQNLDEKNWELIDETHPQFSLKNLLSYLEIKPKNISEIKYLEFLQSPSKRDKLVSYSFLPAEKTDEWIKINDIDHEAISNLKIIEAKNNFEEAKIIALIMRKALEEENQDCALISNSSELCLMVKNYLKKWQIEIDDSHNNNLENSAIVNYFLLIAELFENDFNLVNLLALLKHEATAINQDDLINFEIEFLRKVGVKKDLGILDDNFSLIKSILEPLSKLFEEKNQNLETIIQANIKCAENLSGGNFYKLEGAEEFVKFLGEILAELKNFSSFNIETKNYSKLIRIITSKIKFLKDREKFHPRLHILSTLEARLLNYDLVIISGLNEGEFPDFNNQNAWLGKKICNDLGLNQDKKIGISAYDFANHLGNKNVIITRSKNSNNSPTSKSRFLLRLEAVLKAVKIYDQLDFGKDYQEILKLISDCKIPDKINLPRPKPLAKDRPKKISVTDVSKWLRDPYYIYAKRVLKLKPLDEIDREPSFSEFGNFVHKALENFVQNYEKFSSVSAKINGLLNIGQDIFGNYFPEAKSKLLWWPRFENIANWFVLQEEEIRNEIAKIYTELELSMMVDDVQIKTKIDRINILKDGNVEIIDYKTGLLPKAGEVKSGLEPQLALEALIFAKNNSLESNQIKNLKYFSLKGRDQNETKDFSKPENLIEAADIGITELIAYFSDELISYTACPNIDIYKENDYYHLARISEIYKN